MLNCFMKQELLLSALTPVACVVGHVAWCRTLSCWAGVSVAQRLTIGEGIVCLRIIWILFGFCDVVLQSVDVRFVPRSPSGALGVAEYVHSRPILEHLEHRMEHWDLRITLSWKWCKAYATGRPVAIVKCRHAISAGIPSPQLRYSVPIARGPSLPLCKWCDSILLRYDPVYVPNFVCGQVMTDGSHAGILYTWPAEGSEGIKEGRKKARKNGEMTTCLR